MSRWNAICSNSVEYAVDNLIGVTLRVLFLLLIFCRQYLSFRSSIQKGYDVIWRFLMMIRWMCLLFLNGATNISSVHSPCVPAKRSHREQTVLSARVFKSSVVCWQGYRGSFITICPPAIPPFNQILLSGLNASGTMKSDTWMVNK